MATSARTPGQHATGRTCLPETTLSDLDASLAPVDAELARRYPGDTGGRQPVHTVYIPADQYTSTSTLEWGQQALEALDRHAPDAATLAAVLGTPGHLAEEVYRRVRNKLEREPVEDLRIDFEDGYGARPDADEDSAVTHAAAAVATGPVPPWIGLRMKCMEAPVRARGVRTLDLFLTGLLDAGALPDGLILTLPKVTYPEQVAAMATCCARLEAAHHLPAGRLTFEIQVETPQSIIGPDGRVTIAGLIDAAAGRCTSLHYGTYDYSASCGVSAAHQAMDHPAADFAKAVMQVAAAGTGVRLSDGSSNVLPVGDQHQVHQAWRLHHNLVLRSLARAYYQGWDMHPAQLPSRYAAVYTFYREGLDAATSRLAAYVAQSGGAVMDEPATAKALSGYLLRGVDCGALDLAEVTEPTGLTAKNLAQLAGR